MNLQLSGRRLQKDLRMKIKLDFAVIVLAAGKGVRMKSSLPKVLHPIADQPMIARTLSILNEVGPCQIIVVVNRRSLESIKKTIDGNYNLTRPNFVKNT